MLVFIPYSANSLADNFNKLEAVTIPPFGIPPRGPFSMKFGGLKEEFVSTTGVL
ncbi:uncharacterized protein ASCRUDRAFT_76083 [Ascoidea rubescens DSM 1968]|uniref:Uncharacterized protein n=1 Tax=Ascoidea rubescens DSM 1968 TaxID=1344418 RepID=A0A1D2VGC3_9ASCO|nr:hypothetical protein ASCRUDRAFT_76083 [Ascoidea rubescens DSM 1968]ODV60711.1 hypothetical protein ASCRUDRAFT_76083 [Ascoidea rubescens DSM 1968]